jgi:cell division protein FtsB
MKLFLVFVGVFFVTCGSVLYFAGHGIRDLLKLEQLVAKTQARSDVIEKENQKLRRRVKSLENPEDAIKQRELREFLGWVKSEEWVYLEKARR